MKDNSFSYEIVRHLATLSMSDNGAFTTEVNMISYNGTAPKLDIRKWDRRTDKLLKGVTLNEREAQALKEALTEKL